MRGGRRKRNVSEVMKGVIFFNVPEARMHLLKCGEVFTLREKRKEDGLYAARAGNYYNFEPIGIVLVRYIKLIREPGELEPYVEGSGFLSVEDWLKKARGSLPLHLHHAKLIKQGVK